MNCCTDPRGKSGYTLVIEECASHGGFSLRIYSQAALVDDGNVPLIMSGTAGSLEGPHEFYDLASTAFQAILQELCRCD